jgi:hypothetical protein
VDVGSHNWTDEERASMLYLMFQHSVSRAPSLTQVPRVGNSLLCFVSQWSVATSSCLTHGSTRGSPKLDLQPALFAQYTELRCTWLRSITRHLFIFNKLKKKKGHFYFPLYAFYFICNIKKKKKRERKLALTSKGKKKFKIQKFKKKIWDNCLILFS